MVDAILQGSDTISEKWMSLFLTFLESFVSWTFITIKKLAEGVGDGVGGACEKLKLRNN